MRESWELGGQRFTALAVYRSVVTVWVTSHGYRCSPCVVGSNSSSTAASFTTPLPCLRLGSLRRVVAHMMPARRSKKVMSSGLRCVVNKPSQAMLRSIELQSSELNIALNPCIQGVVYCRVYHCDQSLKVKSLPSYFVYISHQCCYSRSSRPCRMWNGGFRNTPETNCLLHYIVQ